MRDQTKSTIEVSRGLLVALGGALVLCLVALGFFLGRESGRRGPAASPSPLGAVTAPPLASGDTTPPGLPPAAPGAPSSWATPPPVQTAPATTVEPAWERRPQTPGRDEVARYFVEMEAILEAAKDWSDPQALANTLLKEAASGDTSGFDALITKSRDALSHVRAVSVPAVCAEHHDKAVAAMEEAVALLARLRDAITGGDLEALAALGAEGQALERRTKEVDAIAAKLKAQYDLR